MKTRILATVLVVFALSMSVNLSASSAAGASPIDLGTLGGTLSFANDVNAVGQVVGISSNANEEIHPFLWENGEMTDLGTLGGDYGLAASINDIGQIVGESTTTSGALHAFLWQNGVMTDLGTFGEAESAALDINNAGQILLSGSTSTISRYRFYIWDSGVLTPLENNWSPFAIGDQGQVIGQKDGQAVIWENGDYLYMGTLGGPASYAYDISSSGLVAGLSYGNGSDIFGHGFLWENGMMIDLGTLGGEYSEARAVNNNRQVVGGSVNAEGANRAFIWDQGIMYELNTLGGSESGAEAINDNGLIVGASTTAEDTEVHAVLWQSVPTDTTAPTITWMSDINDGDSFYFGSVPSSPTCAATDDQSGMDGECTVTGYGDFVGTFTLTATAMDLAGNIATESRTYNVLPWILNGFYQPVDMNGIYNIVKGGSTVPFKFEVFAGSTELTDTTYVTGFTYIPVTCDLNAPADVIETTVTGGNSLRYDPIAGQFIYNWKTPKIAGKCYRVTMTTIDGSSLVAYFRLK